MQTELAEEYDVLTEAAPQRENLRAAYVLSAVVAVLAAGISITGLGFPGVYRGEWNNGMAMGNDLMTLFVAVPVLGLGIFHSARGSVRARLLWLGALYYMFYNYAFYVFGMPVTRLYVPLIAAFTLSGIALAVGMYHLDFEAISRRFSRRTPARRLAVFLWYVAVMISILWISQWVKFLLTGKVPDVNGSEFAYQVIAAVDLSFMVPAQVMAGYFLWRRRPWGYVLGAMTLVQGAMYTAVMAAVCMFGWLLTPGSQLISGWFINCIVGSMVCLLCLAALLLCVKSAPAANRSWNG